ncbi:MAG: HD domain-containing protein [Lachnospiraceae bacterium]|nr:HD domain-containing protein [Lachnospiraceae bacterium]
MKLCKVSDLKGGEILAKPIITNDYKVLLSEETILRKDYVQKLIDLEITEVYIKDKDHVHMQEVVLLKSEVEESFKEKVKEVLERHTYNNSGELAELQSTAEGIISNILEEEEVVEKIFDIKERSADIYEHSISLCSLSTLTALKLNRDEGEVHDIGVGCLLHDLGLRYLTVDYVDKDPSEFSKLETMEYLKHPVYGYSAVKDEGWLSPLAKNIILYHHERLDGNGFPLKATDIPYAVGIVSLCDTFDEMICGIGCKRVKVYEAVEYLKTFKGVKYYADAIDTFLEFTAVYPVGSTVILSDGSQGKVVRQNREFPDRPVILLSKDSSGKLIPRGKEADLTKINDIFIEKELI